MFNKENIYIIDAFMMANARTELIPIHVVAMKIIPENHVSALLAKIRVLMSMNPYPGPCLLISMR